MPKEYEGSGTQTSQRTPGQLASKTKIILDYRPYVLVPGDHRDVFRTHVQAFL